MHTPLAERIRGSLLGLAIGDALGARFEGASAREMRRRYPTPAAMLERLPGRTLHFTDDTEMAFAVAEVLAIKSPTKASYAQTLAANFSDWRGYGRGTVAVLKAILRGVDVAAAPFHYFADGSLGNGAAVRVAPIGLVFGDAPVLLENHARASAKATHAHPLGIAGAVLMAHAVAFSLQSAGRPFVREQFFDTLQAVDVPDVMMAALVRARAASHESNLQKLGTGTIALESVPTALASFANNPDDVVGSIAGAILLGGDCDTIAAMVGALVGARHGESALPPRWLDALEPTARTRARHLTDVLVERRSNLSPSVSSD